MNTENRELKDLVVPQPIDLHLQKRITWTALFQTTLEVQDKRIPFDHALQRQITNFKVRATAPAGQGGSVDTSWVPQDDTSQRVYAIR